MAGVHASVQPQLGDESCHVVAVQGTCGIAFFCPDLDARQRADGNDVARNSGVRAQMRGDCKPALRVARRFFGVREDVADVAAVAVVFVRRRLELRAELGPSRGGVERKAWVGLRDRQVEAGAEAFAEACRHDETTLIVEGVLDGP